MEVKAIKEDEWQIEGGLVLKKEKVYVPKDEELRAEIILVHHNVPAAGYGD